ncbi:hypothetical protein EDB80DRAFT_784147 [Ilyonectria destructans]|nr:hypothetical protein EDB80DRAFT_784147 [Ilyonectria destructans]
MAARHSTPPSRPFVARQPQGRSPIGSNGLQRGAELFQNTTGKVFKGRAYEFEKVLLYGKFHIESCLGILWPSKWQGPVPHFEAGQFPSMNDLRAHLGPWAITKIGGVLLHASQSVYPYQRAAKDLLVTPRLGSSSRVSDIAFSSQTFEMMPKFSPYNTLSSLVSKLRPVGIKVLVTNLPKRCQQLRSLKEARASFFKWRQDYVYRLRSAIAWQFF